MKIAIKDFQINPKNQLLPPTIQCVHPKTPHETIMVTDFMKMTLENITEVAELMVVFLSSRSIVTESHFPMRVIEIPESCRQSPHIRYGYGALIGNDLVPIL